MVNQEVINNNNTANPTPSDDNNTPINDELNERIARALQLQFDLEDDVLRAQATNTTSSARTSANGSDGRISNNNARPTASSNNTRGRNAQEQQAIDRAIKIQFELEEDIHAQQASIRAANERTTTRSSSNANNRTNNTRPSTRSSERANTRSNNLNPTIVEIEYPTTQDNDIKLAKKIDQELRDEQLAMRLQEEETQPSLSSVDSSDFDAVAHVSAQRQSRKQCTYRTMLYIITAPLLIAAGFSVLYMFFGPNNGSNPIFPGFPIFPDVVLHGSNNHTLVPWPSTRGHGLDMTMINALDAEWHKYFDDAVANWDNGQPDSLTLSSIQTAPDSKCSPVQGMIKVCNGNYGNTAWKGINEIMVKRNTIISSIAKINDYYSNEYTDGERRYLMCHEIGHGFGLPHADENFNNKDLGTCMDYTMRPEKNQLPNERDYELLLQMYGPVDIKRPSNLRRSTMSILPEQQQHRHVSFLDTYNTHPWRMIHGNEYLQEYELDVGNDVKMQSCLLLR